MATHSTHITPVLTHGGEFERHRLTSTNVNVQAKRRATYLLLLPIYERSRSALLPIEGGDFVIQVQCRSAQVETPLVLCADEFSDRMP